MKGVVSLAKGLRKVKTKYPLVIAILPDVTENHREILVSQGCIVRKIEPVYPPENQTQFAMANYMSSTTPTYVFGRYICMLPFIACVTRSLLFVSDFFFCFCFCFGNCVCGLLTRVISKTLSNV